MSVQYARAARMRGGVGTERGKPAFLWPEELSQSGKAILDARLRLNAASFKACMRRDERLRRKRFLKEQAIAAEKKRRALAAEPSA